MLESIFWVNNSDFFECLKRKREKEKKEKKIEKKGTFLTYIEVISKSVYLSHVYNMMRGV